MPKKNNKKPTKKKEAVTKDIQTTQLEIKDKNETQEVTKEDNEADKALSDPEDTSISETSDFGQTNDEGNNLDPEPPEKAVPKSNTISTTNSEDTTDQAQIAASCASPPKIKKRLTLLERLALAAKGKKQRSTTATPTSSADATPPASDPAGSKCKNIEGENDLISKLDKTLSKLSEEEKVDLNKIEAKFNSDDKSLREIEQLKAELERLKATNHELAEENKRLKAQTQSNPVSNNKEITQLNVQLSSKDETIEQLMNEGQALSVKELKLNESIKKLKASNNDLEQSLDDFSKKNEQVLLQFNEQEDYLKKHKFKSVQQLIDSYNDISKKLSQAKDGLEKEKQQDWESKYKEQQGLFDVEAADRKQTLKNLNEVKIQFDMFRKQNSLELDSKNSIINDLKRKISNIRDENAQEIYRLENKVESLRVVNEHSNDKSNDNRDYLNYGEGKEQGKTANSRQIDYEEFVKLSNNHHNLQQQYLSSQENWKLIESNLLSKVDMLTSSIDLLKKSKTKLTNDLQKLQTSLQNKVEENNELTYRFDELKNEKDEIGFQNQVKDTDYQELQERFEKFQQIYNTERQKLNSKIKQLTESLEKNNNKNPNVGPFKQTTPTRSSINGLHLNLEPPKFTKNHSSTSVNESSASYTGWPDIKFGESSTTPAISREFSSVFMDPSRNSSLNSLMDTVEIGTELADDNYSSHSKYTSKAGNGSISGIIPTSGNNNIQLINKMSSNIRRLEIELNTMKDEYAQLSLDKEQAQREILKQFNLSEEITTLKDQIKALKVEIEEKSIHEETMLELIGEKSEQVEELRADVQDLKELCKSQVQQMIEIQESK